LKELQSRELADRRQLDDQRLLRSVDEAGDRLSSGPGIGIGSSRFFTAGLDRLEDGHARSVATDVLAPRILRDHKTDFHIGGLDNFGRYAGGLGADRRPTPSSLQS